MAIDFGTQVAADLAVYSAARRVLANVPEGTMLNQHQVLMQQVVADFMPDCPHDPVDGRHNRAIVSRHYTRVVGGQVRAFVWCRCTCGLAEGQELPTR